MASTALSMRFVQTWLSSPGLADDGGYGVVVVAHDGDAVAQLVAEHDQRALEAVDDADGLDGARSSWE